MKPFLLLSLSAAAAAALRPSPPGDGGSWSVKGNSNLGHHRFLGTTDDEPLDVRTNDATRMVVRSDGDVDVYQKLFVGPDIIQGTATLHVAGSGTDGGALPGDDGEHVAIFESTGDTADGIAIKLSNDDGHRLDGRNNFLTFYDEDDSVVGRVEAFTFDHDGVFDPPLPTPSIDLGIGFSPGSLPSLSIDWTHFSSSWSSGSLPSISFSTPSATMTGMEDLMCWALDNGLQGFVTTDPFTIATLPGIIAGVQACKDGGVTYGSKGADYAEWLPKADASERFHFGQVVGVTAGRASKRTAGADQMMVVSEAPIVAGNLPPKGDEDGRVLVAFLGQVPVFVRGPVAEGDFLVPSGDDDGAAVAVRPDSLRTSDLARVLGRAWSAFDGEGAGGGEGIGMVNAAIGLRPSEIAEVAARQERRLDELEERLERLESLAE